ncbi:MAG: hypothetical protein ABEJ70_00525 [Halobacteriaceae archaeon]
MDRNRAFRYSGYYFLFTALATVVGVGLILAGVVLGLDPAWEAYVAGQSYGVVFRTAAPGLVPALFGVVVWRFGKAWALYHTLTGAVDEELAETFDRETLKSDILSVLDDRLADMQQDLNSVNRNVKELREPESEFQFGDD